MRADRSSYTAFSTLPSTIRHTRSVAALAMGTPVLVLNQDFSALTVCGVQRAIALLHLRKADTVAAVNGRYVRSISVSLPWPRIIRLRQYVRAPYRGIALSRKNILRRDGYRCQYCGTRDQLTVDHVLPKSRGGAHTWRNMVAACIRCNNKKGNRKPEEAGMLLTRSPFRPSRVTFIRDHFGVPDEALKPYLFIN